jgi:hypothetical protein
MSVNNNDEFRAALEDCWNALNSAYWASNTTGAKDKITGSADFVSALLDVMYVQSFQERSTRFGAIAGKIAIGNTKLKELKEEIDSLIQQIDAITNVISTIDRVLGYIPLLPL